jgi:hypothetical protein
VGNPIDLLKMFLIVTLSARKDQKLLWYYGKTGSLEQASRSKSQRKIFFSDDKRLYMNRKVSSNGYSHHDKHEHVNNS